MLHTAMSSGFTAGSSSFSYSSQVRTKNVTGMVTQEDYEKMDKKELIDRLLQQAPGGWEGGKTVQIKTRERRASLLVFLFFFLLQANPSSSLFCFYCSRCVSSSDVDYSCAHGAF